MIKVAVRIKSICLYYSSGFGRIKERCNMCFIELQRRQMELIGSKEAFSAIHGGWDFKGYLVEILGDCVALIGPTKE